MEIRLARGEDIEPALSVIGEAFGLTVRAPSVHTLVAGAPDGHLLVAADGGRIVGTGTSVAFGPTAWIGGVAVAARARGQRLGQRLTEAAIDAVGERETVLLLASAAGRPIYDRLGFEPEGRYRVFMTRAGGDGPAAPRPLTAAPPPPAAAPSPLAAAPSPPAAALRPLTAAPRPLTTALRPLTAADRDAVLALDARVTGERREFAIDASLEGALATADLSAVALNPPWPAHPILATDPAAGAAVLRAVVRPGVRIAVPEANTAAIATIETLDVEEREPVTRMRRGPAVDFRPHELWGVFSLFFG